MSMTKAGANAVDDKAVSSSSEQGAPRSVSPIVPRSTISGRALVGVVAIMTFLASLTVGAVMLVRSAANDWQADVAREVTIQIRAPDGRDPEAEVAKAVSIARAFPGIAEVRPFSKDETMRLLEPWLGSGLQFSDLPVPRMIVVRTAAGAAPDLARLRALLAEQAPGAVLDDHRGFLARMRTVASAAVAAGLVVLALVLLATVLSVMFATRAAMATNRTIIEVLHLIGAKDDFIATHFQQHFLRLGFRGGLIGGGAAIFLFLVADVASRWLVVTAAGDQFAAMFGTFSIGLLGYLAVLVQIGLVAAVTAVSSRHTVRRTIDTIY